MILIGLLLFILLILGVVIFTAVGALGAGTIIVFGDVIVCIVFIILLIRWLMKKK